LYSKFPEHFVWDDKKKEWKPSQRGVSIGRIAYAASSEGEKYYLRILLAHVKGPTSFIDLLTINGYTCSSFQKVALKHEITAVDNVAELSLLENVDSQMSCTLRKLFASLLVFCEPPNPREFWTTYYPHLSKDFRYREPNNPQSVMKLTVRNVQQSLDSMGKSFLDFWAS